MLNAHPVAELLEAIGVDLSGRADFGSSRFVCLNFATPLIGSSKARYDFPKHARVLHALSSFVLHRCEAWIVKSGDLQGLKVTRS